jgi:AcrR family transcriptional regulator
MHLFWRHGFEATSLTELTRAMGVTSPSVYAAYGDKKGLFRAAVRRYVEHPRSPVENIRDAPSAEVAARAMIEGAAVAFTGADTPPGCLLASSAIAVSAEAEDIRRELASIRSDIEAALRNKILDDIGTGAMPAATDASALAAFVIAIIQGLSTLARDGGDREKLSAVGRLALSAWPRREGSGEGR